MLYAILFENIVENHEVQYLDHLEKLRWDAYDFLSSRINRKQLWVLAEFKHPTHQISFHTLSALNCLTFDRSEIIYDRKRKNDFFMFVL